MTKTKYIVSIISIFILLSSAALYFFWKDHEEDKDSLRQANDLRANICFIDHAYIFSLKFDSYDLPIFEFVLDEEGTFSPYDSSANPSHFTGNGFLIDSLGACLISANLARPWESISETQFSMLKAIANEFRIKYNVPDLPFTISGQSLGIYLFVGNMKDFIEYAPDTSVARSGEANSIIFPVESILLSGLGKFNIGGSLNAGEENDVFILNMNPHQIDSVEVEMKTTSVKASIQYVEGGSEHEIDFMDVDSIINEGAAVINSEGQYIGPLQFEKGKWHLRTIPDQTYDGRGSSEEPSQIWEHSNSGWTKTFDAQNLVRNLLEGTEDTIPPTISFDNYQTEMGTGTKIYLTGFCSDNNGVTGVAWENTLGESGLGILSYFNEEKLSWTFMNIIIHEGRNDITVTAIDGANNTTSISCVINGH